MSAKDGLVVRSAKNLLSLNLGSVIRTLLGGRKEGLQSLEDTYRAVSPFSPLKTGKGTTLLQRVPAVALSALAPIPEKLTFDLRFVDVDGAMPYRDVVAVTALAVAQNPKAVLEFGTYFGSTTANLALNLPAAQIHTLDLPEDLSEGSALVKDQPVDDEHLIRGRQLGKAFRGTPLANNIIQHYGDTATYDYSAIQDDVTLYLVDGSHTYEYAKSDTLSSFAMATGQCSFLWHDCDCFHPGVTSWLVEMIEAGLPVVRVENTSLACMKIDADDARVRGFAAQRTPS
jgi:hypothetical protein